MKQRQKLSAGKGDKYDAIERRHHKTTFRANRIALKEAMEEATFKF
jgi:hypothetical protein